MNPDGDQPTSPHGTESDDPADDMDHMVSWPATDQTGQTNQTNQTGQTDSDLPGMVLPFDKRDLSQFATCCSPARLAELHYSSYMEFVWFVCMAVQVLLRTQPDCWMVKLLYNDFPRCAKLGGRLFVEQFGQTRHIVQHIQKAYTLKRARKSTSGDYTIQTVDIDFCQQSYTINMPDLPGSLPGGFLGNFFQAAAHLFIMAVNMPAGSVKQPKSLVDELCRTPVVTHFFDKAGEYVAWLHGLLHGAAPDEHRAVSTLAYSPAFPQMLGMLDPAHRATFLGAKLSECFVAKALAMLVWSLLRTCLASCTDKLIVQVRRLVTPRGIIDTKRSQLVRQVTASFDRNAREDRTACVRAAIQLLVWARSEDDAMMLVPNEVLSTLAALASNQPHQPHHPDQPHHPHQPHQPNQPHHPNQPHQPCQPKRKVWFLSAWLCDSKPGLALLSKLAGLCETTNCAIGRNGFAWLGECQTCVVDDKLAKLGLQLGAATTIGSLVKTRLMDMLDSAISIAASIVVEADQPANPSEPYPSKSDQTNPTNQASTAGTTGTDCTVPHDAFNIGLDGALNLIVAAFSNRHGNTPDRILYGLLCVAQHGLLAGKFDKDQLEGCSIAKSLDAKLAKAGLDDKYARHARTIVLDLLSSQAETAPGARFGQAVHAMHT